MNENQTTEGTQPEIDFSESRWLLMGKDGQQKIVRHRFGWFFFFALFVVPFWLLLDTLIQKLWGWFFAYLITVIAMAMLQAAAGGASGITIVVYGFFCLFYGLQRHVAVRQKLSERGWLVVASSKEFFQFKAVREWKGSGIDVKDPFRNPRLPT